MRHYLFLIIMFGCFISLSGCDSKEQTVIKTYDTEDVVQYDADNTLDHRETVEIVESSPLSYDEEITHVSPSNETPKNMIQLTANDWAPFLEFDDADEAQKAIDLYPELASTANTGAFEPYANYSHHFVGHVYGAFAPVLQLDIGDVVTVYDDFGRPYQYEIDFKQKYSYKDPNLPQILDELINSQNPGIILQTCASLSQSKLYFLHGSLL